MSSSYGRWHGLHVERDGDDLVFDVFHPHTCRWSIEFHPRIVDTHGAEVQPQFWEQRYCCDVSYEQTEYAFSDQRMEPGFHWIRMEHVTYPSGPWGAAEYDTLMEWVPASRPRLAVEADAEFPTA